ncbi:MAG: hypothetical protein V1934_06070, partial [Methanobacteriota archaeon]
MKKDNKMESKLKDHKQNKKVLLPPLLNPKLKITTTSWQNDRLPEMLWAVLVVGNTSREVSLDIFRYIAKYVHENQ